MVLKSVCLVLQAAIVVVDDRKREVFSRKYNVRQPMSAGDIIERYDETPQTVASAIDGYMRVTGDLSYVHPKGMPWGEVKKDISELCRKFKCTVFAKGISLESRALEDLNFFDLAWWGCPKYPYKTNHDPLAECRFFSKYIP